MLNLVVIILGVFIFFSVYLYLQQERMIFLVPPIDRTAYSEFRENQIEIQQAEQRLSGWKVMREQNAEKTVLYFGGNAEDVVYMNYEARHFRIKQLFAFNYPGYGKSSGKPSQQSIYEAALRVYDRLLSDYQLEPKELVIMGRSLGSAVATYVAAKRKASGLILITPFDSMENIAANHYRLFPVRLLLKHRFATIDHIANVESEVLMLAAEQDEIVARENLMRLQAAIRQKNRVIQYANVGHNDIQAHPAYYRDINRFIESN